jgi:hypothetical protein
LREGRISDADQVRALTMRAELQSAFFAYELCSDYVGAQPSWQLVRALGDNRAILSIQNDAKYFVEQANSNGHAGSDVPFDPIDLIPGELLVKGGVKLGVIVIGVGARAVTRELTEEAAAVLIKKGAAYVDDLGQLVVRGSSAPVKLTSEQLDALTGVPNQVAGRYAAQGVKASDDLIVGWGQGIGKQGSAWEGKLADSYAGSSTTQLPGYFKTFDFYDGVTKEAISAKTLNTMTPARLERPETIYNTLMRYVGKMEEFESYTLTGVTLEATDIASKTLALAIPARTTEAQMVPILRAVRDAASRGVNIAVTVVR